MDDLVERVLAAYPQIYFACHARHRRDPSTGTAISERQASILDHLDGARPTGLSELAEHFGVTLATMSVTVDRLVRAGHIVRCRAESDRRRVELRLTGSGERLKAAMQVLEPALVAELVEHVPADERAAAVRGLELLAAAGARAYRSRKESRTKEGS